jgi:hypothetical protein
MSFRFHPDAEAEFLDAIQYYEDVQPGLGLILQWKYIRRFSAPLHIRRLG